MTTANGYTWFENVGELVKDTPEDSITSRTFYQDDQVKAILFAFDAGQSLSKHTAAMPAIIHILEGEADVEMGDKTHAAQPGAWFHMDANLPHSVIAKTKLKMLLLMLKQSKQTEADSAAD